MFICLFIWGFTFIYLFGVLRRFQHCTTGSWKGRGNQYIQFVRVLYCKLPTNRKQLPAFPLEAMLGIKPRPQRWEARVLPLCHRGPGFYIQHCTGHITMGSFVGRGNQQIQFVKVLYCKLPTIDKQLPTFLQKVQGLNQQLQRWELSVVPLCPPTHLIYFINLQYNTIGTIFQTFDKIE